MYFRSFGRFTFSFPFSTPVTFRACPFTVTFTCIPFTISIPFVIVSTTTTEKSKKKRLFLLFWHNHFYLERPQVYSNPGTFLVLPDIPVHEDCVTSPWGSHSISHDSDHGSLAPDYENGLFYFSDVYHVHGTVISL